MRAHSFRAWKECRIKAGSCLSCGWYEQPEEVWVIQTGQVIVRLCDKHMKLLSDITREK